MWPRPHPRRSWCTARHSLCQCRARRCTCRDRGKAVGRRSRRERRRRPTSSLCAARSRLMPSWCVLSLPCLPHTRYPPLTLPVRASRRDREQPRAWPQATRATRRRRAGAHRASQAWPASCHPEALRRWRDRRRAREAEAVEALSPECMQRPCRQASLAATRLPGQPDQRPGCLPASHVLAQARALRAARAVSRAAGRAVARRATRRVAAAQSGAWMRQT